jgi:putative DNA primase/helicase
MLNTLAPGAVGAEDLTPEELPFLRFEAEAQELFDGWRADLEHRLRAEEDHPVLLSHLAKYRSLLPSLAPAAPPATTARGPKRSYTPAIAAVKSAPAT